MLQELNDDDESKQKFIQASQSVPQAFIMHALCEKKAGNTNEAHRIVDDCIAKFPEYSDGYLMKAQNLLECEKYKLAIAVYQSCEQKSTTVQAGLGECYKNLKKLDTAIEHYT